MTILNVPLILAILPLDANIQPLNVTIMMLVLLTGVTMKKAVFTIPNSALMIILALMILANLQLDAFIHPSHVTIPMLAQLIDVAPHLDVPIPL